VLVLPADIQVVVSLYICLPLLGLSATGTQLQAPISFGGFSEKLASPQLPGEAGSKIFRGF
jgi:hypothetical protein